MSESGSSARLSITAAAARLLRAPAATPLLLVVMGVSGCGKSTVGERLGAALQWPFLEGDSLHPAANVARLRAGLPLDDAMRRPWLDAIATWLDRRRNDGESGIVACSALKRSYRDRLRGDHADVCFAWLRVGEEELRRRLSTRRGHFMPASLLDSQLATLEPPQADEAAVTVDADGTVEVNVRALLGMFWSPGVLASPA